MTALLSLHKHNTESTVVVKCGEEGAIFLPTKENSITSNEDHFSQSATKVDVIDTTGAGDAFNAGFIYSMFGNGHIDLKSEEAGRNASKRDSPLLGSLQEAVRLGCAAGSWSVTQNGACVQPLTAEKLNQFLAR